MRFLVLVLALAGLSAGQTGGAQGEQTFRGVITDDMCPLNDHAAMQMGDTAAECARACVEAHGASFVLYDGSRALGLSDQRLADTHAGRRVDVAGTLDAAGRTITVRRITAIE